MKILFYFSREIIKERYRRITTPRNECNTNVIYTRISIKMRIGRAYRIISPGHLFITLSRMRESFFSQNKHKSNKNRIASSYLDPPVWEKYPIHRYVFTHRVKVNTRKDVVIRDWKKKWEVACYFPFLSGVSLLNQSSNRSTLRASIKAPF